MLPRTARLGAITLLTAERRCCGIPRRGCRGAERQGEHREGHAHRRRLPGEAQDTRRPDHVQGHERRRRRGHRVRGASNGKIVGEVENIAPGLSGEFSLTLKAGDYTTKCPGGDKTVDRHARRSPVRPTPSSRPRPADRRRHVPQLPRRPDRRARDRDATRSSAAVQSRRRRSRQGSSTARRAIPYERIEPVAETFGDLDPRIDAREGDVPDKEWGGFHKIEQALYVDDTTDGDERRSPTQLLADVKHARGPRWPDVELEPATIANGAVELLNEVSASKITGEEERYSHTRPARLRRPTSTGSKAAFDAVQPLLTAQERHARRHDRPAVRRRRHRARAVPAGHRLRALHRARRQTDTKALSQAIDALAEPLSKVAKQVVKQ